MEAVQFIRRAHPASLIRVNVGVDQRCRAFDVKPSAILPPMSTRNAPAGQWNVVHMVRFAGKLTNCQRRHIATVSISAGRWRKRLGRFKKQTHKRTSVVMDITAFKVSHPVGIDKDATALRAARERGQSSMGAMERYMRGFDLAQNSRSPATTHRQQ